MPEFLGTAGSIALQKRLRDRQPEIARSPDLANGGRILHFLDPERTGWARVRALAEADRLAGFPLVERDATIETIREKLGPHWRTPAWLALRGTAERVLASCAAVMESVALPEGWWVAMHERPDAREIDAIQDLNSRTGVSPYPAYYMHSEAVPVLTARIRDADGVLVATASVADRYHARSRLAGHVFAGMVSVSDGCRGRGIGKLVNALVLVESHRRFGWSVATEQVAADNAASRAMILACGLDDSAGLHSVAAIDSEEGFTR